MCYYWPESHFHSLLLDYPDVVFLRGSRQL